jgi:hypothetical protein
MPTTEAMPEMPRLEACFLILRQRKLLKYLLKNVSIVAMDQRKNRRQLTTMVNLLETVWIGLIP